MIVLRSREQSVLATILSGIAATLLPDSLTAHSEFMIPNDVITRSNCKRKTKWSCNSH
jgi:hypothetical protein